MHIKAEDSAQIPLIPRPLGQKKKKKKLEEEWDEGLRDGDVLE